MGDRSGGNRLGSDLMAGPLGAPVRRLLPFSQDTEESKLSGILFSGRALSASGSEDLKGVWSANPCIVR